jgi:hypothetical protein
MNLIFLACLIDTPDKKRRSGRTTLFWAEGMIVSWS